MIDFAKKFRFFSELAALRGYRVEHWSSYVGIRWRTRLRWYRSEIGTRSRCTRYNLAIYLVCIHLRLWSSSLSRVAVLRELSLRRNSFERCRNLIALEKRFRRRTSAARLFLRSYLKKDLFDKYEDRLEEGNGMCVSEMSYMFANFLASLSLACFQWERNLTVWFCWRKERFCSW